MATSRERIQSIAGESKVNPGAVAGFTSTPNETDERGVLKELDSHQIEKMTRDQVLDYQQRRSEQIEAKRAEKIESDNFERYKEAFVEAGGKERDAEASWQAHRTEQASREARTVADEALDASRRRVIKGL